MKLYYVSKTKDLGVKDEIVETSEKVLEFFEDVYAALDYAKKKFKVLLKLDEESEALFVNGTGVVVKVYPKFILDKIEGEMVEEVFIKYIEV